ncbi:hypothetical protein RB593_001273 [Gaeumannomyces tritici]
MNFGGNSNNTMASGQPAAGSTEKADFGDKAFDFASKKAGHPVDRNAGEKITDAARGVYEKATGNNVYLYNSRQSSNAWCGSRMLAGANKGEFEA